MAHMASPRRTAGAKRVYPEPDSTAESSSAQHSDFLELPDCQRALQREESDFYLHKLARLGCGYTDDQLSDLIRSSSGIAQATEITRLEQPQGLPPPLAERPRPKSWLSTVKGLVLGSGAPAAAPAQQPASTAAPAADGGAETVRSVDPPAHAFHAGGGPGVPNDVTQSHWGQPLSPQPTPAFGASQSVAGSRGVLQVPGTQVAVETESHTFRLATVEAVSADGSQYTVRYVDTSVAVVPLNKVKLLEG
eukprot:Rhum_TRINITY_DN18727_c0_g1::Rhum_TRINITY_DN18727_c0_g1_i1::g.168232::m.168232